MNNKENVIENDIVGNERNQEMYNYERSDLVKLNGLVVTLNKEIDRLRNHRTIYVVVSESCYGGDNIEVFLTKASAESYQDQKIQEHDNNVDFIILEKTLKE